MREPERTLTQIPHSEYDFSDDFLYFFQERTSAEKSDREAEVIARLTGHGPDRALLDLGCGSGRIANRLAQAGGAVVGLDASTSLVAHAREEAARRGVAPEYRVLDMRAMSFRNEFDAVVSWYSSFGYFGDEENRSLLERCHNALRPGGMILVEVNNRDELLRNYLPAIVVRRGDDLLVDENSFDPLTGRTAIRRTIIRGDHLVRTEFWIRLYAFTELRDLLLRAGFTAVSVYSGEGTPLLSRSPRMILTALKP